MGRGGTLKEPWYYCPTSIYVEGSNGTQNLAMVLFESDIGMDKDWSGSVH